MIDPELQHYLSGINQHLVEIKKHQQPGFVSVFFRGVVQGIGSVIGVAIALLILGWVLNTIGVIPAFREGAGELKQMLEEIRRVR